MKTADNLEQAIQIATDQLPKARAGGKRTIVTPVKIGAPARHESGGTRPRTLLDREYFTVVFRLRYNPTTWTYFYENTGSN